MRSVLLCLLTSCFSISIANAQELQAGLKIGASIPDIKGNTEQSKDYTSRLGPFFGMSFSKKISSAFNLQTEVNYSPQGGKRDGMQPIDATGFGLPAGTILYADFKNETKLNYLEVPVLLQFVSSGERKDHSLFFFANFGPYAAFRITAKTVTSGTSSIYLDPQGTSILTSQDGIPLPAQSFDATTNIKNEIKGMNFGVVGGIGTGLKFDRNKLILEGRFTRGLTNIQTHPEEAGSNKTGSLIFSVGYTFLLN
ncbi:MAG: porin family protein [Flavisolibacter sp.]